MINIEQETVLQGSGKPELYYDEGRGKYFVRAARSGEWRMQNESQIKDYLKVKYNMSGIVQKGESVSEVQEYLVDTRLDYVVHYAGRLAGHRAGHYRKNGSNFLVTTSPDLIKPEAGEWPVLSQVFERMLGLPDNAESNEEDQRPYFFGWIKHTLECLHSGYLAPGLAVAFAGEPKCGKSLIVDVLQLLFGGGCGEPYRYMAGLDNFNSELFESVLLKIDDDNAETKHRERKKFAAELKKIVATSGKRCRGMHSAGKELEPMWRLVICVNLEEENLMVLPHLSPDVQDKISLFKAHLHPKGMPMPAETPMDRKKFWDTLKGELPAFVHWILEWDMPRDLMGRFGVKHYHHPEISEVLLDSSPEVLLHELLERTLFKNYYHTTWEGSSSELHKLLMTEEWLSSREKDNMRRPEFLGRLLTRLSKLHPDRYSQHREGKDRKRLWTLTKERVRYE